MNFKPLRQALGAVLFVAVLMISTVTMAATATATAETITVKMGSDNSMLQFVPSQLMASPGDTIKWVNNKLGPHNVIFDKREVKGLSQKSLLFASGESYESAIPTDMAAGTYEFYCQPHRGAKMVGTLTIQ